MKLHIQKAVTLLLVLLCVVSLASPVLAAQPGSTLEGIKVTVKVVHPPKYSETYKIVLTPDQEGTPMPEGAADGVYMLSIKGTGESVFPAITYSKVGIYHYTIKQLPGSNKRADYDPSVYQLTVYVTREKGGLEVTPVLTQKDRDEKPETIAFTNTYPENRPNTPKTNDESNFPLYLGLSAASIAVLAILFLTRRREENEV